MTLAKIFATAFSGAILRDGGRPQLVTLFSDGSFRPLHNHSAVIPVDALTMFTSRMNVISAAVKRGSWTLSNGSSVSALSLNGRKIYGDFESFIDHAAVGRTTPEDRKAELKAAVRSFYGITEA